MKEQVSWLAKSAIVQYVTIFCLILAKRVKHWSRAWDRKASYCKALMWVVTSVWPQKVVCRTHICSARATLMHISDQARDLVKNCFEGQPLVSLSKRAGILNKSTVPFDDLCGESKSNWARVIWWHLVHVKYANILPDWVRIFLSVWQTWLMVWFPEVVDKQNSGMSWCSCSKNIFHKYKNASWLFSWSDFVLDNRFWAQERWILGLL